jgi:hypothetical protein
MPSLGRLVRGLTLLFWGLPIALVVCVQTARTNFLAGFGLLPPVLANAAVLYGLMLLGGFRPQERVWIHALDRAKILAVVALGLAPFLYWWRLMPEVMHYQLAVALLALTGLLLLGAMNLALQRLASMLPDDTLRLEARLFTRLNLGLLAATLTLAVLGLAVLQSSNLPPSVAPFLRLAIHLGMVMLLVLILLPLALTMTLLWKIKEAILASVFGNPPAR